MGVDGSGWEGSCLKLAYPFPVQLLLHLHKSQDRIHSKFIVPIATHNGKTNLSVGLAICIFCYQLDGTQAKESKGMTQKVYS